MSNTALCLTALLLLIPIIISYKEGLHIIKDLVVASIRAVVQLLILGLILEYIFKIDQVWILLIASKGAIRESIRLAIVPTIDSVKTYGLVSIPGMMTGLIIGGMAPLQAIKFQLLVVFIHTTATIMSALIATYLSYGQFFNARHQLVARTTNIKDNN